MDIELQETEVSRLDPEKPPLALALAGVVNVQAVTKPAIRRTPARVRGVRDRDLASLRLFALPLFRISDSSWHPCDRVGPRSRVLPPLDSSRPEATVKWYHPGSSGHLSQRAARISVVGSENAIECRHGTSPSSWMRPTRERAKEPDRQRSKVARMPRTSVRNDAVHDPRPSGATSIGAGPGASTWGAVTTQSRLTACSPCGMAAEPLRASSTCRWGPHPGLRSDARSCGVLPSTALEKGQVDDDTKARGERCACCATMKRPKGVGRGGRRTCPRLIGRGFTDGSRILGPSCRWH